MAFTFISSSAADLRFARSARDLQSSRLGQKETINLAPVRRPHRGIQVKDDTYAVISIYRANGEAVPLVSSSARSGEVDSTKTGYVKQYSDFILQSVSEQRQEKQQIIETFGDSFVFFFGERPRIVTISGLLLNTEDFNWRSQFWANYENFLRGTRLVQQNARMFLAYDTVVMEGYPIGVQAQEDAQNPYSVQFTMQFFLTNYQDFSNIGSVLLPDHQDAQDFEGVDVLNRELSNEAEPRASLRGQTDFKGTTAAADVRALNFQASLDAGKGFGGFVREATKTIRNNAITDLLDTLTSGLELALTGRVISVPAGVTGFLAQVGSVGVAANSLGPAGFGVTGLVEGDTVIVPGNLNGNVKLRFPATARFVEQPQLRVPIYQNWDEYPLTFGTQIQVDPRLAIQADQRAIDRAIVKDGQEAQFVALELATQKKNEVLRTISDIVNFTRKGFALVANASALIRDPAVIAADTYGLGVSGVRDLGVPGVGAGIEAASGGASFGIPGIT